MPDIGDFIRRSRRSAKIAIAAPGTPGEDRRIKSPSVSLAQGANDLQWFTKQCKANLYKRKLESTAY